MLLLNKPGCGPYYKVITEIDTDDRPYETEICSQAFYKDKQSIDYLAPT